MTATIRMTVNGKPVVLDINPDEMLADVLRERLGLLGTKIGCREGECGACTVLLEGQPVVSCLLPALKANDRSVVTVEGLGPPQDPHPVQEKMALMGASQCGYCSPGFVMSAAALLDENASPSVEEIKEAITGNLCRCTGYAKIILAIREAARAKSH